MDYPKDLFFDIETLINVAQPTRILLIGDCDADFLSSYKEQKQLIQQSCEIDTITSEDINQLWQTQKAYDVAIAVNLFEHLEKAKGMQVLSRLRDVLSPQYCIALPTSKTTSNTDWHLTDLFSFALSKVTEYSQTDGTNIGLFKYNISDYKKTPDWLNADNWANPQMWGKYWW